MSSKSPGFRDMVAAQKDELYELLAQIGLDSKYDIEVPIPAEDTPLADLYVAVQITADNLKLLFGKLEERIRVVEQQADTIRAQGAAIMELSTPVIQLAEGIAVVPLIGALDTKRASQITEQLLSAISSKQIEAVIVDVTGIPIIDTSVAAHLIRTVQAAKMLGARCILTGISPPNAQTLAIIGVPLSDILTKGSLEAGLACALELTNREITEKKGETVPEAPEGLKRQ